MGISAEIISVGTELLLGDIVNTNAQYLSRELAAAGVDVYTQTTVGDNPERLKTTFSLALEHADIAIATGGLGPTADDLTKEIAAETLGLELDMDDGSLERIQAFFSGMGMEMPQANRKQALMPRGARILPNDNGTAPGCLMERGGKTIILLPGPPSEMRPMFERYVAPLLADKSGETLVSRTLRFCGIGESAMSEAVADLLEGRNPTAAPYAKSHECILRISAKADSRERAEELIRPVAEEVYRRLGAHIYGEGDAPLEEAVAGLLLERGLTLATAESCTGGLLAGKLTNLPGISQVFLGGAVTYSNGEKIRALGVKPETLRLHGAVSAETAAEMAEGIARNTGADIGVSITGIAGPEGGNHGKPVGLVYIGLCAMGRVNTQRMQLSGGRERVRGRTLVYALDFLRTTLLTGGDELPLGGEAKND